MEAKRQSLFFLSAALLLLLMAVLSGGAAFRESVTIDEVAHIGAGVSYLQKFDLRFNQEHPPLAKMFAAVPLLLRGARADYSHLSWTVSDSYFAGYFGEWVFGERFLNTWNDPVSTLAWARLPMLLVTLVLGWVLFAYARRLGGNWGGLLCLSVYVATPTFLVFGPLVHTDISVTLFSLLNLWCFAELWQNPSRKNTLLFALTLAGALLSKFTAGILFFAFIALALSTRWRAIRGQPAKPEARAWRRLRWRLTLEGIAVAALIVYVFYSIFSWKQPTAALYSLGQGPLSLLLRRLLMPPMLYFRSVLVVLFTSSRPSFLLGHSYSHGVWFYYPVLLVLKSPPGFLGLLVLALALALALRQKAQVAPATSVIPAEFAVHWRVLWSSLVVFTGLCLLSRMDISIRHFTIPISLLILMLSPLPHLLLRLSSRSLNLGKLTAVLTGILVLSCLFTGLRAYPYFFSYLSPFSFGHPGYFLVNDSNLDWNQSLPEVRSYAEQRGIEKIALDFYGFADPTVVVPQAVVWDCQKPAASDGGQWVVVSGNMIMDGHNCVWLTHYPLEPLAGGSMWAVHLPEPIPDVGSIGGPPLPESFRQIAGLPRDMRSFFLDLYQHPEKIQPITEEMQAQFEAWKKSKRQNSSQTKEK